MREANAQKLLRDRSERARNNSELQKGEKEKREKEQFKRLKLKRTAKLVAELASSAKEAVLITRHVNLLLLYFGQTNSAPTKLVPQNWHQLEQPQNCRFNRSFLESRPSTTQQASRREEIVTIMVMIMVARTDFSSHFHSFASSSGLASTFTWPQPGRARLIVQFGSNARGDIQLAKP